MLGERWGGDVSRDEALRVARALLGPAGLLGYLLGRGSAWHDPQRFTACRKSIGAVMGRAYLLLAPVWGAYPDLDPGKQSNPLGLPQQPVPADPSSPADLLPLLHAMRSEVPSVLAVLQAAAGEARIARANQLASEELEAALGRAELTLTADVTAS